MAKWSLHAAGEIADEKLHQAAKEIGTVLRKHGLGTSQFHVENVFNGPLPEPEPKAGAKADE